MKKQLLALIAFSITLACSLHAQIGRMGGSGFNATMAKLFGDNTAFSADFEMQVKDSAQQTAIMPGKIAYDAGKTRFEMNLSDAKGGQNAGIAQHMKMMGMDKTVTIARPDTKVTYMIFPGLTAYAETPLQDPDAGKPDSAFKIQTKELGRENLDGHPCVKNKVVITDDQGKSHESTVWNASDLKKFPIKIETTEQGRMTTLLFKNVKTSKPEAMLFEPPRDYKKYESQQALMQQEVMKRLNGMKMPPGHP